MRTERLAGTPGRLRSFDPARVADLEFRVWVGYYLRDWPGVLRASIGLVRAGFGMDWVRTLGCRPDSPLLAREHAALVRSYAALLAAVHH
jgi:hypothetical protein